MEGLGTVRGVMNEGKEVGATRARRGRQERAFTPEDGTTCHVPSKYTSHPSSISTQPKYRCDREPSYLIYLEGYLAPISFRPVPLVSYLEPGRVLPYSFPRITNSPLVSNGASGTATTCAWRHASHPNGMSTPLPISLRFRPLSHPCVSPLSPQIHHNHLGIQV